jgi:hypothetical protein
VHKPHTAQAGQVARFLNPDIILIIEVIMDGISGIGCSFKVTAKPIHPLVLLDCLTGVPLTALTAAQCLRQAIFLSRFDGYLARCGGGSGENTVILKKIFVVPPTLYVIGPEAHP